MGCVTVVGFNRSALIVAQFSGEAVALFVGQGADFAEAGSDVSVRTKFVEDQESLIMMPFYLGKLIDTATHWVGSTSGTYVDLPPSTALHTQRQIPDLPIIPAAHDQSSLVRSTFAGTFGT